LAGSGLGGVAERLELERDLPYAQIDGFPLPRIPGHPGRLLTGKLGGKRAAVFAGRFHAYEGASHAQTTLPVQVAAGLGARAMALTSSVGSINAACRPGDIMLVADHIGFFAANPLYEMARAGADNPFAAGEATPFVDLTRVYRADLFEPLRARLGPAGERLRRGVLAIATGPTYETPAEVRMLRALGADAVCMSTVPEAIYARYAGLDVVALCLVTNRANDGSAGEAPSHEEVLAAAAASAQNFSLAVAEAVSLL
jgi:purine-nucleoside phosphorylase